MDNFKFNSAPIPGHWCASRRDKKNSWDTPVVTYGCIPGDGSESASDIVGAMTDKMGWFSDLTYIKSEDAENVQDKMAMAQNDYRISYAPSKVGWSVRMIGMQHGMPYTYFINLENFEKNENEGTVRNAALSVALDEKDLIYEVEFMENHEFDDDDYDDVDEAWDLFNSFAFSNMIHALEECYSANDFFADAFIYGYRYRGTCPSGMNANGYYTGASLRDGIDHLMSRHWWLIRRMHGIVPARGRVEKPSPNTIIP